MVEQYPVITKETLDNGDCFYSSIYRASSELGLLEQFIFCLGLDTRNEDTFIQSFRNLIAFEIEEGRIPKNINMGPRGEGPPVETNVYNYLTSLDQNTYSAVIEAFPYWYQKAFPKRNLGDKQYFLQKIASYAKRRGAWIAQFEAEMVQRLLKDRCDLELIIHNSSKTELPKISAEGKTIIHLINNGESHYEYFSFNIPAKKKTKYSIKKLLGKSTRKSPQRKTRKTRKA